MVRSSYFEPQTVAHQAVRAITLVVLYSILLGTCQYVAYGLRFDFTVPPEYQREKILSFLISWPVNLGCLLCFRQFRSLLSYFSLPDLLRISGALLVANVAVYGLRYILAPNFLTPRGVVLINLVLGICVLSTMRLGLRMYRERVTPGKNLAGRPLQKIAIVGAGDAGATLAKEFLSSPSRGFRPVMFLDDDRSKHGHQIHGVPVVGPPEAVAELKEAGGLTKVVIAMPSASAKRIREIVMQMTQLGLKVETLPSMEELASGRVRVSRIRPVEVQDLLGRDPVNLDSDAIRSLITGKVAMVTGAGGSIGSELCRQIAALNPKRLLMLEQAEGSLFNIEQELNEAGYGAIAVPLIADVLDERRIRFILERYTPDVIFHAAAHKHVGLMERQPGEAVKNNTTGTRQLAELASAQGIATFVLVSTDKAINPTSVMGATKRLAEMHVQIIHHRPQNQTRFITVRFGNVLGSSGSVIPIFKQQIAAGGPVTVTHPDVTRYFMTIPEAVGLILQTAVLGRGGEIFVLDMGNPVKIVDLARNLIELSGLRPDDDIEIKFIGLRPGEKLYEELQHHTEQLQPTTHPRVLRFASPPFSEQWRQTCMCEIEERSGELEPNQLKQLMKKLVPEYRPFLD